MKRNCEVCGNIYNADDRNLKRGWGLCCSKRCAAIKRENDKKPRIGIITETKVEYKTNDDSVYVPKGCYAQRDVNGDICFVDHDPNSWRTVR